MLGLVPFATRILCALVFLGLVSQASADVVRSQALIQTIPVQGVTLSMTPRQAFETLKARGYSAGKIESFDDWRRGGLQMVRGNAQDPRGESYVVLGRQPGRLINIGETTNRPHGERFDYESEIAEVRRHFGIADDERSCMANVKRGAGACSVSDGNNEKPFAYVIQVRSTARMVQLGYAFEPTVGLDDQTTP